MSSDFTQDKKDTGLHGLGSAGLRVCRVFEFVGVLGLAVLTLRRGGVTLAFPFVLTPSGFQASLG